MSRQFRVVAVIVAVAAIAFVVYRNHRHHYRTFIGGPVFVLVAKKQIPKGTTGYLIRTTTRFYKVAALPIGKAETGAITDEAELNGKLAVRDIPVGQELTTADFAGSYHPIPIFPGGTQRAVVIKPLHGIDRRIAVGSKVDVWDATAGHGSEALRGLYRNMQVLAVSKSGGTVTLRATARQAGRLIYASENERLVVRLHQ